jgi:ribosome-associated protein
VRQSDRSHLAVTTSFRRVSQREPTEGLLQRALAGLLWVSAVQPLVVRQDVVIPADALSMQAVRSGGPGGQNVNKVASKIELRVDLARVGGMSHAAAGRLRSLAAGKLDAEGRLLVVSQRSRDSHVNLEDAREKVRVLVLQALVEPKRRRKTRPTRGSVERRIADKKRRGSQKADRRSHET